MGRKESNQTNKQTKQNTEYIKIFLLKAFIHCSIYPANKCLNANNCWHFNIYEQNKFHTLLSWPWKKFYNLGQSFLLIFNVLAATVSLR